MLNVKCRTEYSFRAAYGTPEQVIALGGVGICDRNGTWGHVQFAKAAKKAGIKPLFGVELAVVNDASAKEKQAPNWMSFIAKNNKGLKEIYELTTKATENFYYFPRIDYSHIMDMSDDVALISGVMPNLGMLPRRRDNIYIELSPNSNRRLLDFAREKGYKVIACSDNYYPTPDDRSAYEVVASSNKDNRTTPMHILNEWEWRDALPWAPEEALVEAQKLYDSCEAVLPTAEMVHFRSESTLMELCVAGASKRGIDIVNKTYAQRLTRELDLIEQKKFEDYFYVIADLVNYAKQHMLVGPARGSSCGSLVCYLLGITDIDPLPYDLLFERFIDINREDLPDIDIDFQDDRRELVFDHLRAKYGADKVARLGTVMRYKAKSAIDDVSRELSIPVWEVKDVKDAMIERSSGDSRAQFCILDTFESLEVGRKTLEKFPELVISAKLEGHARQSGQHAAGVLVTAEPVSNYCSVDRKTGAAMIDKKDAEDLGMLKIDALGLRTLSVIQDALDQIGWPREKLLQHPMDDEKAFDLLMKGKFSGIFQFEGFALQNICRQMPVRRFEDIAAITALARPGPLTSGGTSEYVKRHNGEKEIVYTHELVKQYTEETHGIVVYQEQVMQLVRNLGKLTWEDTSTLRKAMSKSYGKEYFDQFKERFVIGAKQNGLPEKEAGQIWDELCTFGAWGFNKCLHGKTKIKLANAGGNLKERTIEELYEKYFANPSSWIKQRKSKPWLVSLNENGIGMPQELLNIHKNGKKPCWRYEFNDGSFVECTEDHKFLVNDVWKAIGKAKEGDEFTCLKHSPKEYEKAGIASKGKKYKTPQEGFAKGEKNPGYVNGKTIATEKFIEKNKGKACEDCGGKHKRMETHHNDFNGGKDRPEDLVWLCPSCHKKRHFRNKRVRRWERGHRQYKKTLVFKKFIGIKETYDIEMPVHHNFCLGNDLVTHNSHAIAYGLVSYWCCILKAHFPLEFAAACLRNSKDEEQAKTLIRELVREGYEYKVFDKERSKKNWSVSDGMLVGGYTNIKGCGDKMAEDIEKRKAAGIPFTARQQKLMDNPETPFDNIFEAHNLFGDFYENHQDHNLSKPLTEIRDISDREDGEYLVLGKLMTKNLRDLNEVINVQKRGGRILDSHTEMLNFSIGDDTGQLRCNIGRYDYPNIGKKIVEEGKIGDWYIFKGNVRKGFLSLSVKRWRKLSFPKE